MESFGDALREIMGFFWSLGPAGILFWAAIAIALVWMIGRSTTP
jgi:hypothetical protein